MRLIIYSMFILQIVCNLLHAQVSHQNNIAIIGAGYVGLTTSAVLTTLGHSVICVDIDTEKIQSLTNGIIPIYERGLASSIHTATRNNLLTFTTDCEAAVKSSNIIIICVATPLTAKGTCDLTALHSVAKQIAPLLSEYKIICIKSTVPPGTHITIKNCLQSLCGHKNFAVVSNPEFLREGSALSDFFEKNPIVLGGQSTEALDQVQALYQKLINKGRGLIRTDPITAELIKYAWNAYSFLKIAYVNELADLCQTLDTDHQEIVSTLKFSEELLPINTIVPGPGIGGSCLPKDITVLNNFAQEHGDFLHLTQQAVVSNSKHMNHILKKLYKVLGENLHDKTIAILGLSFKANTDDIRNAPALIIIQSLLDAGATVKTYDPKAMHPMQKIYPHISYCDSAYAAATGADALIVLTEWSEFKNLNPSRLKSLMRGDCIIDTRGILKDN